jgi:hypothetical protein
MMHEAERGKYNVQDTLNSAAGAAPGAGQSKMIADTLMENYQLAQRLGVFDEPANVLAMERGDAPVATVAGWEDEKLAVTHRVSPLLAPEAARSLANLILIPEALRDAQLPGAIGFTTDTIKKWVKEGLISPVSAEAIADVVLPKR